MPHIRRHWRRRPAVIGLWLFAAAAAATNAAALAQEATRPVKAEPESPTVKLDVLVTDGSDRAVTDLKQEEFRVLEDGKPQTLSFFSRELLPVSYGLVVDSSGSMRVILDHIVNAGKGVVAGNKPGDETFVMRFTDGRNIQLEQGFTANGYALEEALDNIFVEGGQTAVADAVDRAVDYLKKNKKADGGEHSRRQAIVLISDGEDRGSRAGSGEALISRLRGEQVQLFIIGLSRLGDLRGSREKAADFLTRLAEASGGRAFFPRSASEIPGVADLIARDLHTQYVLGYSPTNAAADGAYRKVQVTVPDSPSRKNLKVIARPGYTARRL
jgi:VWFA-related protein